MAPTNSDVFSQLHAEAQNAASAGGDVFSQIHAESQQPQWPLMKQQGESDQAFLNRSIQAVRSMSPDQRKAAMSDWSTEPGGGAIVGAQEIARGQVARGLHREIATISPAVTAATLPFIGATAYAAPFRFLTSLFGGYVGQKAFSAGAGAVGASPDVQNVAGDVGALAGGYAGWKAGGIPQHLIGRATTLSPAQASRPPAAGQLQPALNNTPDEVLSYASSKGIEMTPGQALQSPMARTGEAVVEKSLGSGGLAEAKEANAMKLGRNILDLADRVDPSSLGVDEQTAGQTIQQNARVAQGIAHDNASAAYQQLPSDLLDKRIDVSSLRAKYSQQLASQSVALENRNPAMASQIREALGQISNLGTPAQTAAGVPYRSPDLAFRDLIQIRSDALSDGAVMARAGAPSEVQAIYRRAAGDIDGLMESAANDAGYLKQWRGANSGWKAYLQTFDDPKSPLYQALNQRDPGMVTRSILNRSSAADIQLLRSQHMDGAIEAVQRQVITDIANRGFRVGANGLGGYSHEFLQSLFGPQGAKELYVNGEIARRMSFQLNPSGTSNVMLGWEQMRPSNIPVTAAQAMASKGFMPRNPAVYLPSSRYALPPGAGGLASLSSLLGLAAIHKHDDEEQ